ncbi:hypothetical protein RRG08_012613 [Elysia crispata]|uniref:Uncharacterized protein n=1 Tax=Elysia crispata TaxID=231223 RepID=A0AAE1A942_9GAST|nr:hypothetical protein RRG08_012613 [Elysia crispata]
MTSEEQWLMPNPALICNFISSQRQRVSQRSVLQHFTQRSWRRIQWLKITFSALPASLSTEDKAQKRDSRDVTSHFLGRRKINGLRALHLMKTKERCNRGAGGFLMFDHPQLCIS